MKYIITTFLIMLFCTAASAQDDDPIFTVKKVRHIVFDPDTPFITAHFPFKCVLSNLPPGKVSVKFSKGSATIKDGLLTIRPHADYTTAQRGAMGNQPKGQNPLYKLVLDEDILYIMVTSPDSSRVDTFTRKYYITIPPNIQLFDIARSPYGVKVGDRDLQTKTFTFRAHNVDVFNGFDKPFSYVNTAIGEGPTNYGAIELKVRTTTGNQKLQCKGSTLNKEMLKILMTESGAAQYGIQLYPIQSDGKINENIFDLVYVNFDNMANISIRTTRGF